MMLSNVPIAACRQKRRPSAIHGRWGSYQSERRGNPARTATLAAPKRAELKSGGICVPARCPHLGTFALGGSGTVGAAPVRFLKLAPLSCQMGAEGGPLRAAVTPAIRGSSQKQ